MCSVSWGIFTFVFSVGLLMGWLMIEGVIYIIKNVTDIMSD